MPDTAEQPTQQLQSLIGEGDGAQLDAYVSDLTTGETARAVSHLEDEDQTRLLTLMSSAEAADLVGQIPSVQAVPLIEHLEPETAAHILRELPSDERADLLGAVEPETTDLETGCRMMGLCVNPTRQKGASTRHRCRPHWTATREAPCSPP